MLSQVTLRNPDGGESQELMAGDHALLYEGRTSPMPEPIKAELCIGLALLGLPPFRPCGNSFANDLLNKRIERFTRHRVKSK